MAASGPLEIWEIPETSSCVKVRRLLKLGGAMPLELALQLIETGAVVVGVVFGLAQLHQLRIQREVQAGLELLGPLQTPESAEALLLMHGLPDNLTGDELRQRLGTNFKPVLATLALFESLGPIVARGHVPIDMFAEFYRGPTLLCWRKVRQYVEEQRQAGWPSLFEWLQWLAERMDERVPSSGDLPAYMRFKSWKRSSDFVRLSATTNNQSNQ